MDIDILTLTIITIADYKLKGKIVIVFCYDNYVTTAFNLAMCFAISVMRCLWFLGFHQHYGNPTFVS